MPTVLTVDDSKTMRTIIKKHLSKLNVTVFEAGDGNECVVFCKSNKPDLIIMDVNMPNMNGKDCVLKLKSMPDTNKIPIIMLTTESEKTLVMTMIKAGIQGFILKPFKSADFYNNINKVLKLWEGGWTEDKMNDYVSSQRPQDPAAALILEDKPRIVEQIKVLAQEKFEILEATTIEEAERWMNERVFDLIFISLPLVSEPSVFATQIKKNEKQRDARIVGMCLKTEISSKYSELSSAYEKVLGKPFSDEDVQEVLKKPTGKAIITTMEKDFAIIKLNVMKVCQGTDRAPALTGEANKNYRMIKKKINELAEEGYTQVVLDLLSLETVDASDMEVLVLVHKAFVQMGMSIQFCLNESIYGENVTDRAYADENFKSKKTIEEGKAAFA